MNELSFMALGEVNSEFQFYFLVSVFICFFVCLFVCLFFHLIPFIR